jgi:hypothetical protein
VFLVEFTFEKCCCGHRRKFLNLVFSKKIDAKHAHFKKIHANFIRGNKKKKKRGGRTTTLMETKKGWPRRHPLWREGGRVATFDLLGCLCSHLSFFLSSFFFFFFFSFSFFVSKRLEILKKISSYFLKIFL